MQLHTLQREHPNRKARQVGRGGTRGKTSGRGGKGQTARAGNKRRPQMRDIIKKLPKLRGYRFASTMTKPQPVNVGALNIFTPSAVVNPESLLALNLIRRHGGSLPQVKILGGGELTLKLTIKNCEVSTAARTKIKKAGGTVE
jgi:large subunit ribosomal protein L15